MAEFMMPPRREILIDDSTNLGKRVYNNNLLEFIIENFRDNRKILGNVNFRSLYKFQNY